MNNDQLKFNTIPRQGTFGKVVDTTNKNFELAKVAIDGLEYATHRNKGLFGTLDSLNAKYPTPNYGDWALVGSSFPCQVYRCDADSHTWVAAGTYQGDNISLNDYVTKAQHNADMETIEEEIEDLQGAIYGVSVEQELTFNDHGSAQALETTIPLGSKIFLSGDLSEVLGMTNVSDTEYQTITSGTITDRNISYIKNGSTTGSVTITAIVENGLKRDVEAIKYDYTDFENKLRGVGQNANGSLYPMYNLGDFANINEVNDAVDSAFATQGNTIKQGRLKMRRNGQIIFVDQFAIDFSQGRWAQMAYGMVAPSSQDDGLTLIQATDHPHIVWRMNGVDDGKWRDLEGNISLKTINGNSLYGEGDLTISEAAQIVVDTALDPSSDNAIANSAVAAVVAEIYSTFAEAVQQVMEEKGTIICKVWQGNTNWPSAITTPIGTYGFDTTNKELLRVNDLQAWAHIDLSEEIVYVDAVNNKQYRWNGSDMIPIGGGNNLSVVDNIVFGNYNPVTSNAVAVAMSQFGIDEVAVIKCWSDDSQDYDNWQEGDYWYDPTEDELWRCVGQQGSDFEKVLRPIIMLKEPNYDVWIWNTQTARKFDVETETSISAETAESTKPPTTAAVYEKVHAIEEAIDDINMEDYRKNSDNSNEKLYPEYWYDVIEQEKKDEDPTYEIKPIIYAKNYYDWNTVWYKGVVSNSGASSSINAEVILPTEYTNAPGLQAVRDMKVTTGGSSVTKKLMTDDVYYDSTLNQFVLLLNGTYYAKWNNSYLWNNEEDGVIVSTHHLRNDTVYCCITPETFRSYYKSNGKAYPIWYANTKVVVDNAMVSIFNTFTDFKYAIYRCQSENNGSVCLHSTKIYGVEPSTISSHWLSNAKDFVIDGQGATICAISDCFIAPDDTSEIAYPMDELPSGYTYEKCFTNILGFMFDLRGCANFTIQRFKVKAVRNAVRNTSSGRPFNFACGYLNAFNIISCTDVTIKDVEFAGCAKDMEIKSTSGVGYAYCNKALIDGWRSSSSGGIDGGQIKTLLISNAHVTTNQYLGIHMMYFHGTVESLTCRNCTFIQDTHFNTNFIQVKQESSPGSTSPFYQKVVNHVFENCYIHYGRGIIYFTPYNLYNIIFRNCTIAQTDRKVTIGGISGIYFWSSYNFANVNNSVDAACISLNSPANVIIDGCSISSWGALYNVQVLSSAEFNGVNGLGSRYAEPFHLAIMNSTMRLCDRTNISTYAKGGSVFGFNYKKIATCYRNNVHNYDVLFPNETRRYRFDLKNIGVAVDSEIDKKSNYPVENKVLGKVMDDVNISLYGKPLDYISGTLSEIPKSAEAGDVYYATDEERFFKCLHPGGNSKLRFAADYASPSASERVVKGRLRVFYGIDSTDYNKQSTTDKERERMCVLDIVLDSTNFDELDISDKNKLASWIKDCINSEYSDFMSLYNESSRKKAASISGNYPSQFDLMTDGGFNGRLNVKTLPAASTDNVTSLMKTYVLYEPETGTDSITLSVVNHNSESYRRPPYAAYTSAIAEIGRIIHDDTSNTDIRFADHELSDSEISQIQTAVNSLWVSDYNGTNPSLYYVYGVDAIWVGLSVDGGIDGRLKETTEKTNAIADMNNLAYWGNTTPDSSEMVEGYYWYNTSSGTTGGLKKCVKSEETDELMFVNVTTTTLVTRFISSSSIKLYIWNGSALFEVSSNPV